MRVFVLADSWHQYLTFLNQYESFAECFPAYIDNEERLRALDPWHTLVIDTGTFDDRKHQRNWAMWGHRLHSHRAPAHHLIHLAT